MIDKDDIAAMREAAGGIWLTTTITLAHLLDALCEAGKRAEEWEATAAQYLGRISRGNEIAQRREAQLEAERDSIREKLRECRATKLTQYHSPPLEESADTHSHPWHSPKCYEQHSARNEDDCICGLTALRKERDRMARMLERSTPFAPNTNPGRRMTHAEQRALRSRWATGPERYQYDADALIIHASIADEECATLRAEVARLTTLQSEGEKQWEAQIDALRSERDEAIARATRAEDDLAVLVSGCCAPCRVAYALVCNLRKEPT